MYFCRPFRTESINPRELDLNNIINPSELGFLFLKQNDNEE